jgi:hypothetical protein
MNFTCNGLDKNMPRRGVLRRATLNARWRQEIARVPRMKIECPKTARSQRTVDASGICKYPHGVVVCESMPVLMAASAKARVSSPCTPLHVAAVHSACGDRNGNPSKSVDSLTCDNRPRRLSIQVVDGHDNVVCTIVINSDRYHIVGDGSGGHQHQGETEEDDKLTYRTHLSSQRCWLIETQVN